MEIHEDRRDGDRPQALIAFDGSADAERAIAFAALLLPGAKVTVLTVWEPLQVGLMSLATPMTPAIDWSQTDHDAEETASHVARRGAHLAAQAGLDAHPRWDADGGNVWDEITAVADDLDARMIVTGSRGLSGMRSMLSGSVSTHVVHLAGRPVLVVPSDGDGERE